MSGHVKVNVYCNKLITKHDMMTYWCKHTATVLCILNNLTAQFKSI
jgi:hypothetical protein